MSFVRCSTCKGFLHHAFITEVGIDVYRCNGEDSFNEKGRYFIFTGLGQVEVEPISIRRGKSREWSYQFVDLEQRRLRGEEMRINEELNKRQKLYQSSIAKLLERAKYDKYAEDADE